jgi:hypothetical protein
MKRPIEPEKVSKKKQKFKNTKNTNTTVCGPLQPPINIEDLLPHILPLATNDCKDWKEEDVQKAIKVLKNRTAVVIRAKENPKTIKLYRTWREKWETYLESRPHIQKQLDPWYIMLDATHLNNFQQTITELESRLGEDSITVIRDLHLYSVQSSQDAQIFRAYIDGKYGQGSWIVIFSSNNLEEWDQIEQGEE